MLRNEIDVKRLLTIKLNLIDIKFRFVFYQMKQRSIEFEIRLQIRHCFICSFHLYKLILRNLFESTFSLKIHIHRIIRDRKKTRNRHLIRRSSI